MVTIQVQINQQAIEEIYNALGEFMDQKLQEIVSVANPPVDTGFLKNSGYVVTERINTFDQTWSSGVYESTKGRGSQRREKVDRPEPYPVGGGVVGFAAIYAWWIEDSNPFFYNAILSVVEE